MLSGFRPSPQVDSDHKLKQSSEQVTRLCINEDIFLGASGSFVQEIDRRNSLDLLPLEATYSSANSTPITSLLLFAVLMRLAVFLY